MSGGGGKGKDQKVPQIDPIALIDAQTKANRVGVNTPFGSQAYSTDANGNAVLNTSLSPEMQALLTKQIGIAGSPTSQYTLPGQNATILNGLNTRLDQRYGMGLPPAPPGGNTGGGNTGGGGGTPPGPTTPPPVTPPVTPESGGPGPSPGNNAMFPGTTPKDWQGERGRFSEGMSAEFARPSSFDFGIAGTTNLGPGAWASQGEYGAGQGASGSGSSGGSFTPGMGSTANNFGIPMPGSGTGNYSDPSSGMPGALPGGYLGSGSYSGMGQGLSAAGSGTSGFGLPTGSVDLSGPATAGYGPSPTSSAQTPSSSGVSDDKKGMLAKLLQSRLFRAAAPVLATLVGGPLVGTGVRIGLNSYNKNQQQQPQQQAPPPPDNSSFYNY